jgi:hypothetical protein
VPAGLRAIAGLAACLLTAASPSVAAVSAAGAVESGPSGYCSTTAGVTVVVDMSALGGGVTVRCAPGPGGAGYTGLDALRGAGFTVAGTQRYGLAFVCRIQGRPSPTESLAIPGNPTYHEQCVDTPPQTAFWSYWSARNGGTWAYNTVGASSHGTIPGGFEGWAFSLGNGSPATPAVEPVRPHAPPPTTSAPTSGPPHHHHGGGGGAPPATPSPSSTSTPAPEPTSSAPTTAAPTTSAAPTKPAAPRTRTSPNSAAHSTGGGDKHRERSRRHQGPAVPVTSAPTPGPPKSASGTDVRVSGNLPETAPQSAGSSRPVLLGAGVLVILGLGAGLTAWRRSQRP